MPEESKEDLVEQLIETVTYMTQTLRKVISHHDFHREEIESYKEEIKRIRDRVSAIVRVVHEGNGERALVTRVAILEEKVERLDEDVNRLFDKHRAQVDVERATKKVNLKGRWEFRIALISAVAAVAAAIITYLAKL